ncbi:MAG TPA: Sip1-related alpha-galactosidase, partial [Pyrinomonadaceae bacterium]|nr:Sip1-related alpha-galactosidase [Pyrinomonadaceae bacterium]
QQAASRPQAAPFGFELTRGAVRLTRGSEPVFSNARLRLRFADNKTVTGDFEAAGRDTGADEAGRFELWRYNFKPLAAPGSAANPPAHRAALELRRYTGSETIVAWLVYDGPALAPRDGVALLMALDSFARGTAQKRLKLYWTGPVFVSDYRLLPPANQLLLWQQTKREGYHLMVPLAGGGMVGELGVAEINYRPEFRVAASSYDPKLTPRRVPLFAYSSSADPYRLTRDTYQTAFAATGQHGRLRWQKGYPEVFRDFGWCSWNAYESGVTEEKILASVRSFRDKGVRLGFVLVDDGWLSVSRDGQDGRLTGFGANPLKFPRGLDSLARTLRNDYSVRHVGVWHTFQGYWSGVERESDIGRAHALLHGNDAKSLPDPRGGRGESFYADWYAKLKEWGFDFVKVDGQANNVRFTDGLIPLFDSGQGSQRNLEGAARVFFADAGSSPAPGLGVINCMEMTLENVYNWRDSNVARNSDDYQPDVAQNYADHVYQNAYNAFWLSNFAYPDWDMFQSHDPRAEFHAAARAASGGPVYVTDEGGKERAEVLRPLAFSDGRLLMLDEPGQVTRDTLLRDAALEPVPLKVFGRVTRPGLSAGVVAAFTVNKSAPEVAGELRVTDVEGLLQTHGGTAARVAVYRRSDGRAFVLGGGESLPLRLAEGGFDFFTLVPVTHGAAVFGLLDKYVGPAAVVSANRERGALVVRLREGGDFGAWTERRPARVELDGRALPASAYSYAGGLLRVPASSFAGRAGEREVRLVLAPRRR